jgi:hypothetical protein
MKKALAIAAKTHIVQNKKAALIFSTLVSTYQGIAISSASKKANQTQAQAVLVISGTPTKMFSRHFTTMEQRCHHSEDEWRKGAKKLSGLSDSHN